MATVYDQRNEASLLRDVIVNCGIIDGPIVRLTLWDTYRMDRRGRPDLAYRFMVNNVVLFDGNDFQVSPYEVIDSDNVIYTALDFFCDGTCWFEDLTDAQRSWLKSYACESLACLVNDYRDNPETCDGILTDTDDLDS